MFKSKFFGWATAIVAICGSLIGCGGGWSATSAGSGNIGYDIAGQISGKLKLSDVGRSLSRSAGPVTVVTPIGKATVNSDGSYSVRGYISGTTPTIFEDSSGNVISFAFTDPTGGTVDNALVAKSLSYLAMKGGYLVPELQTTLWKNMGSRPEVAAIAAGLAAKGGHLQGSAVDIVALQDTNIKPLLATLTGQGNSGLQRQANQKLLISPQDGQSGVNVTQQGFNQIVATNNWRHRAWVFVERTESVAADGTVTDYNPYNSVTDFRLDGVSNPASLANAIADAGTILGDQSSGSNSAFTGNVAWVPNSAPPVDLAVLPTGAKQTTYRAVVVGWGSSPGKVQNITQAMKDKRTNAIVETVALDVFFPLINSLMGQTGDKALQGAGAKKSVMINALKDLTGVILATPSVQLKVDQGDYNGAVYDCVNAFFTSSLYASQRDQILTLAITSVVADADATAVSEFIGDITKAISKIDLVLQGADFAAVGAGVLQSHDYEEFDITATNARVKLTPPVAKISVTQRVGLTATVPDASGSEGPLLTYKFSILNSTANIHLHNSKSGEDGQSVGSSDGTIQVVSENHSTGDATVQVEGFINNGGGSLQSLGTTTSTIHVVNDKALVYPALSSIKRNATQTLRVKINNPSPGSQYMYVWSCSKANGSIDLGSQVSTSAFVTYTAKGNLGSDTVTCDVYQQGENGLVKIGSSTAKVLIEDDPTIIPASFFVAEGTSAGGGGRSIAVVRATRVPGAVSYELVGVGGYDSAYWGDSIDSNINPFGDESAYGITPPATEIWAGISGANGPGSADFLSQYASWFHSRFDGFSFYVIVHK